PHRHPAMIVTAAGLAEAFGQRLDGLALPERAAVDQHEVALARRGWFVCFQSHGARSSSSRRSSHLRRASRSLSSRLAACPSRRGTAWSCPGAAAYSRRPPCPLTAARSRL